MRCYFWPAVVTLALFASGCVTTGLYPSTTSTQVHLTESNYELIATGIEGSAQAGYVLGFSTGFGLAMQTVALYRVEGDGLLYQSALRDLWRRVEMDYGPIEGRSLALVNVRYDTDAVNLLVYTRPRVAVVADLVEFVDD